jgi:hypothetical protein
MGNVERHIVKSLDDLLNCKYPNCEECSVLRQDEGDDEPWCGYDSVIRCAITYIESEESSKSK